MVAAGVLTHVKELKALEAGKLYLTLEPTGIQEIFTIAQIIFEDSLAAKNITLTLIDEAPDAKFLAHKSSFSNTVFNNFISNAIKFSPNGAEIIVKTSVDELFYIITITDQGIGIPEEIGRNLFKVGQETSRKGTHGEGGTGFGMTLAKTYLLHYNAELNFTSQSEGKTGTTFELLLQKAK